jgi:hypothetical protein
MSLSRKHSKIEICILKKFIENWTLNRFLFFRFGSEYQGHQSIISKYFFLEITLDSINWFWSRILVKKFKIKHHSFCRLKIQTTFSSCQRVIFFGNILRLANHESVFQKLKRWLQVKNMWKIFWKILEESLIVFKYMVSCSF